jgi:glyoxylase-like metal-dependent hydrolase (beta-lactamase superfamily II)
MGSVFMKWNDFDIEKIDPMFYVVRQAKGGSNIGVCVKDDSALMVDSGYSPKKSSDLKRILEENLKCRIELLFNTHYHSDHTFGNQSFDCPILSSQECKNIMQANLSTHWTPEEIAKAKEEDTELREEWEDLKITFPTRTFKDELSYDFKGIKIVFQKLGGHSRDSAIAYFPDYKLLFAGDIVFGECYPTLLSIDCSPIELIEALHKIINTDVKILIPGHGTTCDKAMVKRLIEYWECLSTQCRKLVASRLNDERIQEILSNRCHLQMVPMNERKHKRNVDSVLKFVREHPI